MARLIKTAFTLFRSGIPRRGCLSMFPNRKRIDWGPLKPPYHYNYGWPHHPQHHYFWQRPPARPPLPFNFRSFSSTNQQVNTH